MLLIISKVLVVFIYIAVGFAANKLRVLPSESSRYFIDLIMEITVPCLMISSITGRELDGNMYRNTILTFVLSMALYLIMMFLTSLFADHVFRDIPQQDRNVLASAMTGCNSGFMGYPVAKAVFGNTVFYYVVIQTIANNLYLFCMSIAHLHHKEQTASGRQSSRREILKSFFNITTIATIVAVVMLFASIRLPAFVMDITTTIGDITIPLSMILVGIQLGGSDFGSLIRNRDLMITALAKLTLAPALAVLLLMPVPVDPIVKLTIVLSTSFPSAVIGVAVSAREHSNSRLMAEAVAASTMLSMITLPVWIIICTRLYL
ncbi:MAG: AEC family transporter [Mogibacterium sp.]|nr:AEC family transporter [Mogibacterium sp.]